MLSTSGLYHSPGGRQNLNEDTNPPEKRLSTKLKRLTKFAKLRDGIEICVLQPRLMYENKLTKVRRYLGDTAKISPNVGIKKVKTVLLFGESGSGKSSLVNKIVNFVYKVNLSDQFRVLSVCADEEMAKCEKPTSGRALGMTSWVTGYELRWCPDFRYQFSLFIIDTPGFKAVDGGAENEELVTRIRNFFENGDAFPYDKITSISYVLPASDSRKNSTTKNLSNQVLGILASNLKQHLSCLFTYSDFGVPTALKSIEANGVPYNDYFLFNNTTLQENFDRNVEQTHWANNENNLRAFFDRLDKTTPVSLDQIKYVLTTRHILSNVEKKVELKFGQLLEKLQDLDQKLDDISNAERALDGSQDFESSVISESLREAPTVCLVTNCNQCGRTCRDRCFHRVSIIFCRAFDWAGNCRVCGCPGMFTHLRENVSPEFELPNLL